MHKCANVPAINNACTIYDEPRCMAMERITQSQKLNINLSHDQ